MQLIHVPQRILICRPLQTSGGGRCKLGGTAVVSSWFDATLDFPGEGQRWRQWALWTLTGATPLHSEQTISRLSSTDEIHLCLLALAGEGNSPAPIAARIPINPRLLGALLGDNAVTSAFRDFESPLFTVPKRTVNSDCVPIIEN